MTVPSIAKHLFLFVFALLTLCQNLFAETSPLELTVVDANQYPLTPYVTILEDTESQWTIDDVLAAELASKFKPANQGYLNFGYSDSTFWIRLQLRYTPTKKRHPSVQNWYYEVGKAQLNVAELYIQRADGSLTKAQADIRIPYAERPLRLVNSVFPVSTPQHETITLYLRASNVTAFYIPLTLWNPTEFVQKTSREEILYGIFFGGMLIMIVYNLFVFISMRDPSYIFYSAYLVFALTFEAIDMGHGAAWMEEGRFWFNKEYVPISIWGVWISSILFARYFLEIPKRHPLFDKFYLPMLIFSSICAAFCFLIPFQQSIIFSVYFCGYASATIPVLGAYAWYKGNKNASYFTLAWLFNITGFVILSSVATGNAPATPMLVASMPLGTLLESVMLSFALAERIKRTQKEVLQANALSMRHLAGYRSLLENAVEGIYQVTLQGRLLNANPSMARMLGYPSVNALMHSGKKVVSNLFNNFSTQWRELARGNPLRNEISRSDLNGSQYVALHSVQLIRDAQGRPAYIEGTMIDITELHQREQAERERLRERKEKTMAEAVTQAKSQFLKSMSFEIRTPLNAIIGFSESLRDNALEKESKHNAIATIMSNSQTLLQLVNDILDYSKIEAEKMFIERIEVDLMALLFDIQTQFESQATARQLQFKVDYQWPLPPRIISDPTRLKQILQNLCSNAIKYTLQGTVCLRVCWDDTQEQLVFSVIDTGIGMAGADDAKPVSALQRGGLGIAITRELCRLLGGKLQVASAQSQGSTFTASIRCKTSPQEQWISTLASAPKASNLAQAVPQLGGHVLLAEDNPVNQQLISRIISKTGAKVTVVPDGEQALNAALSGNFALVLMDINMPVMGGLEATAMLRAQGYDKPVYALTAEYGLEEIQASLAAGCNGHLSKPVETEMFYTVLSACLPRKGKES